MYIKNVITKTRQELEQRLHKMVLNTHTHRLLALQYYIALNNILNSLLY